jgi:hypothetical protein
MELSKCKICGDRHRLGFCPQYNPDEERRRWQKGMLSLAPSNEAKKINKVSGSTSPEKQVDRIGTPPKPVALRDNHHPPAKYSGRKRGPPHPRDKGKTLTTLKPWKEQGISRAKWYRQQKLRLPAR